MNIPWYRKYDQFKSSLDRKVDELEARCRDLGIDPDVVFAEHRNDLIARIAQESNWNEGIYLDYGQTRILVDIAIATPPSKVHILTFRE